MLNELRQRISPAVAALVRWINALSEHGQAQTIDAKHMAIAPKRNAEHGHEEVDGGAHLRYLVVS
jgi:hypothetical protein